MSNNSNSTILQYFPASPYINSDNNGYYDLVLQQLASLAVNSSSTPYLKSSLSSVYSGIVTTRHEILDLSYVSPVSWALLGAFTLWFVFLLSLAIWRRNYQPVKARDIFLMIVSIVATYFVSLMVTLRFAFGRYEFPCFFFTFLLLLAYPGLFLPAILRCWRLIFVYLISKKKQLITTYNERRQSLVMKRQSPPQPIFTKPSPSSAVQTSSQPTSPLSTTELLDANINANQPVSETNTPTLPVITSQSANNSNSIMTEDETTTTDNDEARNVAELDDDDLDIEAIEIPNLDHDRPTDSPPQSGKTVTKKLDLFAKLSSKAALSTIIAVVYMIHFAVFVILILTDIGYYSTKPFLQGCFVGTKVYAVLVLTLIYYVTSFVMLIIIWRKVKENWFIRREVFVVMLFWIIDVLLFFVAGIWGSYNLIYEHYFPAGWIILFGCLFDNVVSCLIPIILSFQTSKYQWNDSTEAGNSIEVREILRDKKARAFFKEFATESFVPEGILFWEDAHAFLKIKSKEKKKKFATTIISKYVQYGSNLELNLPNRSIWEKEILDNLEKKKIPDSIFYKLVEHVERDLMDIFVRYKRTTEYKRSKQEIEEKKKELEAQKQVGMR
ncbi:RGS-domain-containing protein [Naegleria gruberi]|uniref:RGS-domain-containing protein n=1 Tax=Naegleria gruberi TaxID=5762 RepID=D2UX22_NAEGR|nr:RGS-domain-containing protein [Naegleria gruberi]EFC50859.1 RGS-domain-containing protein [Naegleria gruberi]|eukprot:XP_002683603.1 RGS-domain-containing protein [Naegleria gruberi strain NEG-M]